jgi:hypothetical protein
MPIYHGGGAEASGGLALGWGAGLLPGGGIGGCSFVFTRLEGDGKGTLVVGGLLVFWFEFSSAAVEFALLLTVTMGESVASAFALAFSFSFALVTSFAVLPTEGISCSVFPVAGGAASTA